MNKRIYFNNKCIEFIETTPQTSHNQHIRFYTEFTEETLKNLINELLSEPKEKMSERAECYGTTLQHFDLVFNFLKKELHYIEAAGGLINKENDYLFIYRLDRWDLPKGKLDKGETIEHAAVRECEEECAVKHLRIQHQLPSTYHVYKYKNSFAIKQTFWFFMTTDYSKKLKPQTEENITDVKWFNKQQIKEVVFGNSYFTIKDVIKSALPDL